MPLSVGMTCSKGLHEILSEDDILKVRQPRKNGKLRIAHRCKACKRAYDRGRASNHRRAASILEVGVCKFGHKIRSEADVIIKQDKSFRRTYYCKQCQTEDNGLRASTPQRLALECGHEPVFNPPIPAREDVIYCVRCNDSRMVKEWIGAVRTDSFSRSLAYGV